MCRVSIITPCYNQEKYIAECLDSVLAQTFDDFEVIVVNDGSTDGSLGVIEKYAERDSRIRLLNQTNQGVVIARNNGAVEAQGEFLYFLDGDDLLAPMCLEKLLQVITTTKHRVVASEAQMFGKYQHQFQQPRFNKFEMYGWHEQCLSAALIYKMDFEKFGGYKDCFNGYGGDDMDYWLNYLDNNMSMYRVPDILFYYRITEKEESTWRNYNKKEFKKRQSFKNKMLAKYHPNIIMYSLLWNLRPASIWGFVYKNQITKKGKRIIKICKIPVWYKKI